MSINFIASDNVGGLQFAAGYTTGAGSMVLKTGQGAKFTSFPCRVTAITNATYQTSAEVLCSYTVTGVSTDTLTGVAVMPGYTDRNFAPNDYVEQRMMSEHLFDILSITPRRYVSLSANGVATSNPATPASGTDVSTTLQAIADDTTAYNVIVCDGGHYKGQVSLQSGRGIEGLGGQYNEVTGVFPKTGLILPQTCVFGIRNKNWTTDVASSNGVDSGTTIEATLFSQIIDQDIFIRNLHIHGNRGTAAGEANYDPTGALVAYWNSPAGAPWGMSSASGSMIFGLITLGGTLTVINVCAVHLHGVRNAMMENVSVYDSPFTSVYCSYIDSMYVSNLNSWSKSASSGTFAGSMDMFGNNSSGTSIINFDGTAHTIRLRDISGSTPDDAISFNAWDGGGSQSTNPANMAINKAYYLYYDYANGPQTDITVDGVTLSTTANPFRLIVAGTQITSTNARSSIDRVTINNVTATTWGAIVRMQNGGDGQYGRIGNVTLNNFNITAVPDPALGSASPPIEIQQTVNSLLINNFVINGNSNSNPSALIAIDDSAANVNSLIINNMWLNGYESLLATSAGNLSYCSINNCQHLNKGSGNPSIFINGSAGGVIIGSDNIGLSYGGSTVWGENYFQGLSTVFQATDPPAPVVGERWFSNGAWGPVTCRGSDGTNRLIIMDDGAFFKCTTCTALSNSTSEVSLLGSPGASWGSLTIPNAALRPGQWIEIDFLLSITAAAGASLTLTLYLGTTAVLTSSVIDSGIACPASIFSPYGPMRVSILATGASGTTNGWGACGTTGTGSAGVSFQTNSTGGNLTGINFNQANLIDFKGTWAAASSSNSVQVLGFIARLKG